LVKRTFSPTAAKASPGRKLLQTRHWREAREDFGEHFGRNPARELGAAFLPVKTLEVVGQDDACNHQPWRQRDFERITFDVARHGTDQREAGFSVVSCGR
jgi:hypothetical protein